MTDFFQLCQKLGTTKRHRLGSEILKSSATMHKTAFALLLLATAASALPSAPASYSARAPTTAAAALRKAPAPSLHLRGGGLPVNDVLVSSSSQ